MITLTQALMDRRITDTDQAQEYAESLLVGVIDDVNASATEVEPGLLKPDATKEASSFVADAASHAVFSACYRDPDMDLWEEFDDMVDDDELLPDSLESSYSCASAAASALNWMPVEQTDVPARRAFWAWYLNEAIPTTLAT